MVNDSLQWRVVPLTDVWCQELCTWDYSPFEMYNWPSWETMKRDGLEFADPIIRAEQYSGIVDERNHLCGFVQFFPIVGVTRLGLGLRPDLCGQRSGLGVRFVKLLIQEAKRRKPQQEIDLEVLEWNERAIQTYRRVGFIITDTYEKWTPTGVATFHCMVYDEAHEAT
ncbi:N-acetyltransferase [Paenibacillus sp. N3.4]|uniref:GNAT family N-acetyltransferase n=1 Tax=Paenibacillus sp. N3.4 TaxID=2603222 RepID=UPI0011CC83FA|nr:GNAT family N-acetyltransferase [Paenibacillus sp. N3.4]TXK73398.1 GNAT family N-acetyltransferase [Paenibacillus sp. N3.4]